MLQPPELVEAVGEKGRAVAALGWLQHAVLGLLGGAYVSMGFALCLVCGGQLSADFRHAQPGAFNMLYAVFGFPMGLTLCVVNGASLFTSNVACLLAAALQRKAHLGCLVRVWAVSYLLNLAGALLVGQLLLWSGVLGGSREFVLELAAKKTSLPFGVALVRGVMCNWLVCLAVNQAAASEEVAGVAVAIWLPISGFVALGFEHCVANMFLLPLAARLGASTTWEALILHNLLPVTIGNVVGGGLLVALPYWVAFRPRSTGGAGVMPA